jgi:hypothetical protein
MFGRMSFVSGDPGRIDDLITYVRTVVKPATDQLDGNYGLGMWANRETGDALVMTVWKDEATMLASEDAVIKLRDDAAGIIGGNATVERYEAMLLDANEPHQVGNIMRLLRMRCDSTLLDSNVEWARENILPKVRMLEGYLSYSGAIDRANGMVASMSTFRDAACAAAAMTAMQPIRDIAQERGITIESMTDYEVAIVGIRAPVTLPSQRPTVDLTEKAPTRT